MQTKATWYGREAFPNTRDHKLIYWKVRGKDNQKVTMLESEMMQTKEEAKQLRRFTRGRERENQAQ